MVWTKKKRAGRPLDSGLPYARFDFHSSRHNGGYEKQKYDRRKGRYDETHANSFCVFFLFDLIPAQWDWVSLGQELDGRQKRRSDCNLRQQHPVDGPFQVSFGRQFRVTGFAGGFHTGCDSLGLTLLYACFLERACYSESIKSHNS